MSRPIKICIVMPSHWSGSKGGAELQVSYITRFLAEQDNLEIHYICRNFAKSVASEIVHVIPKTPLSKYSYAVDRKHILGFLDEIQPDYIYQRVLCAYTGIAAQYCQRSNAKMIFHVANSPDAEPYKVKWNKHFAFNLLEGHYRKIGIEKTDFIIGQAQYQDDLLCQHFSRRCDIIMPNISPDVSALGQVTPSEKLIVLWVANIKPQKGPGHLLDLAETHQGNKNIEFHMAGKVASDFGKKIKKRAEALSNVYFHGEIPVEDVNRLMASASIFINTSDFEGFPNTFIQAWMNETPVLSLNVDPDDIIKTNALGEHCGTVQQLHDIFEEWISNESNTHFDGKHCRTFALQYFSLDNVRKLYDLIRQDFATQIHSG